MRLDRIMGVILSILVISFIGVKYFNNEEGKDNPVELIGDNGTIANSEVKFANQTFDSNKQNVEIIEYTNTFNHPVEIKNNDIIITCTGSGETKDSDEELARKNYSINARFSTKKDSELFSTLSVAVNQTVYIHVISEYTGELPQNPVECQYKLNVTSS